MQANNRDTCQPFFVCDPIRSTPVERSPAAAIENATLRLQLAAFRRKRKRPVLTLFDRLFWVGLSRVWCNWRGPLPTYRPTRWCAGSGSASGILGATVRGGPVALRQTDDGRRIRRRSTIGGSQSALACATYSRRVADARHRSLRAHRLPYFANTAPAADSNLEDVSSQPPRPNGFHRFL
jgi:hypothetical protein